MKNVKRSLILGVAATAIGFAGTVFAQDSFKVGMDITYPPFESFEGDKVVGFDPEVAALLGKQMGMTPEFEDIKFASLILGLRSNKIDAIISGMYILPERLKIVDAIPYARTGAAIVVTKGSKVQPKSEKDLCGLEVGMQQGESWVHDLKTLSDTYCKENGKPAVIVKEFPSTPEVIQANLSHNIDAQMILAGAAKLVVEKTKGRLEISSADLVYPQTIGIFVNKGNQELKAKLEKALAAITADGSFPAVLEKYELIPVSN